MGWHSSRWPLVLGVGLMLLLGSSHDTHGASAPPTFPTALCPWVVVPSPAPNTGFAGGVALAPDNAWAVGSGGDINGMALVAHWDGTAWSRVPVPRRTRDFLLGATAVSPIDIWAVGFSHTANGGMDTFILHWDGSQWALVPSPNAGPGRNILRSVAVVSTTDVWAVGTYSSQTLIEHWDGVQWTIVPSPNFGNGFNDLWSVTALAANDVWAVGEYDPGLWQPLVLHWDGAAWLQVPTPTLPTGGSFIRISATSPQDIWAIGGQAPGATLIEHWDGTAWSLIPSPSPNPEWNYLQGLVALAPDDAWAVGYQCCAGGINSMLVLHWDGSSWSLVPTSSPSTIGNFPWAAAASPAGDIWALGSYIDELQGDSSLALHYSAPCPPLSPTPALTATTPSVPTATPPPPPTTTPLPTTPSPATSPTPTPCALTFSDVVPAHPFYTFIRCLACRQVVAGYADGSFRPALSVTRRQLAKILANAAGLTHAIPSTQQTFADVPPAAPFWLFIERLAATGAIRGYACGGLGEPCDGQQRPYFRWGVAATRGQISKITALAVDLSDPVPSSRQIFADVPPANPFWLWIEQLAGRGVISGYTCGGPGEPCDGQQRPYFRWGTTATRGQMSKIAAQTFFPGCAPPAAR